MSRFGLVISMVVACGLGAGCGGESDPFAEGDAGGGGGEFDAGGPTIDAGGGGDVDANTDQPGLRCPPKPTRVVVMGDSITDCTVIGGPDSPDCVSKQFFDYVKANVAPDATYLNVAVGGAQTKALAQQTANVPPGPGHLLVMVYMGGNDLAPYIFQSDASAEAAYDDILPGIVQNWKDLFAYYTDTSKFPDGATVIVNNQYNPFDDCTASPYNLSQTKSNLLHMFNIVLGDIANEYFANAILVDQYKPYLGHGHHYNVASCPHYQAGMTPFMKDLIHANADGNKALAAELAKGVDRLYKDCP
jgi:lysophospholipase L1-like esterase